MKRTLWLVLPLVIIGALCWPARESTAQTTTDVVLVGAGDIADGFNLNLVNSMATAALLDSFPSATVFADGDLAYENGTDNDFAKSYDPTWGRGRARTIPVVGNHDYQALGAAGYYNYFGPAAGDRSKGYYSLDLGAWHIIVINSNCAFVLGGGCASGSTQEVWLKNDLAAHTQACTLALWHHPLYTSTGGSTGPAPDPDMQTIFQDLYNANADLVVNGHAHDYERFAPQDANGNLDLTKGIIEIVAGTGGESHHTFLSALMANSLVRNDDTYGVLKLTLHQSSFDWQFVPVAGGTFTDSGSQVCH
jgi:calcineurin-like phosphoesterase family protein